MDKTSLGFQKPKEEEYYDINIFNQNAQLANDLIEKNSSAIGQKLDKNSSFYADLEAYYGNTKLIDDFQDISKWTVVAGTQTSDTTNIKIGSQSLKITENDNTAGHLFTIKMNASGIELDNLNNGEISTDNDYVCLVCYISDIGKIDPLGGVQIVFSQGSAGETTNCKYTNFKNNLVTGWNFLKAKKSDFQTNGTGEWTDIKSVRASWFSLANAQNAYVSFQLIQLVKADPDTLLDRPNPFQKFGVKDFDINSGEWFIGKEFEELCIKSLNFNSDIIDIQLKGQKIFKNFTASSLVSPIANKLYCNLLAIQGLDFKLTLKLKEGNLRVDNGSISIWTLTPFSYNLNDKILTILHKNQDNYFVSVKNLNTGQVVTSKFNLSSPEELYLATFSNGDSYREKIYNISITEISHAHHADVAERLSYRNLQVPSIQLGNTYTCISRTINMFVDSPLVEAEISFSTEGMSYIGGTLEIELSSYHAFYNSNGVLKKQAEFIMSSPTAISLTDSRYTYIGKKIKDSFCISDPYIKDGRVTFKILQRYSGRNPAFVKVSTLGYQMNILLERINISPCIASTDTFVEPSMTPTETVITSGFASGWSGTLVYSKNQEGLVDISWDLTYNAEIPTSGLNVFLIPIGYRPKSTNPFKVTYGNLLFNNSPMKESQFFAQSNPLNYNLQIGMCVGSSLVGARRTIGSLSYYAY